jgi:CHAD domain-containing protein
MPPDRLDHEDAYGTTSDSRLRPPVVIQDAQQVGGNGTATAVVQARFHLLVKELREQEPLVRADVDDAVHEMRVTTRRLRSALSTFRPLLDRQLSDPLRDELTWLAAVLGVARDAEVLRSRLPARLAAHVPEVERGGLADFLERDLGDRYRLAHRRCLETMRTSRYCDLQERLQQLAVSAPWIQPTTRADQDLLLRLVRRDWKRLRRSVRGLDAAGQEDDAPTRMHEVRKAAKRVRYAAETLIPRDGTRAEKLAKALKEVQSVLGDHQDGQVSRAVLFDLSVRATAEGQNAYALGVLSAREEDHAQAASAAFHAVWKRASRPKLRRWLG